MLFDRRVNQTASRSRANSRDREGGASVCRLIEKLSGFGRVPRGGFGGAGGMRPFAWRSGGRPRTSWLSTACAAGARASARPTPAARPCHTSPEDDFSQSKQRSLGTSPGKTRRPQAPRRQEPRFREPHSASGTPGAVLNGGAGVTRKGTECSAGTPARNLRAYCATGGGRACRSPPPGGPPRAPPYSMTVPSSKSASYQ